MCTFGACRFYLLLFVPGYQAISHSVISSLFINQILGTFHFRMLFCVVCKYSHQKKSLYRVFENAPAVLYFQSKFVCIKLYCINWDGNIEFNLDIHIFFKNYYRNFSSVLA